MKLETSLKHFSPQGLAYTDSAKSTSPDRITGTDIMAALGSTASKAKFGLWVFLGKNGISSGDEQRAVQELSRVALDRAPKNVRKAAGGQLRQCMLMLARFAFTEYSRSAASTTDCKPCGGKGMTEAWEDVTRYPGYVGADGEEKIAPQVENQLVKRQCAHCEGKGLISARCRCKGTGTVLDRKATIERGAPVFKECERCTGKGFAGMPSTSVYKAIQSLVPDLHVRTWTRNWKPFYDEMVKECYVAEGKAESEFMKATK
ncbi:antitermination protein [Klebsiella sp. Ap-873]|nr:antitermination protein [Klebsiella sp. Ap-873]